MGAPPSPILSLRGQDPEALATAIRDASFSPCQISAKPATSSLDRVVCGTVCLDFATIGPAMLFSGSMPRDCYTLLFVLACPGGGRSFNFASAHTDGYMGFFAPGSAVDAYTPEGYTSATLTVPASLFLDAVEKGFPEIPDEVLEFGAGMWIGLAEQARLRRLLSTVKEGIDDPGKPLAASEVRAHLERELLDAFLSAVRAGCESLVPSPGQRVLGRLRRLQRARDYIVDSLHGPIELEDLCGSVGLSRRGLELMFHDSLGIGPAAFIRHQRLHGVRRALQAATPGPGVVKRVALDWGFWHMGHFSHSYRSLFGESPSATLMR